MQGIALIIFFPPRCFGVVPFISAEQQLHVRKCVDPHSASVCASTRMYVCVCVRVLVALRSALCLFLSLSLCSCAVLQHSASGLCFTELTEIGRERRREGNQE